MEVTQTHDNGDQCPHEECSYLRDHSSTKCWCGKQWHAAASNWDDYSFGHGGGRVFFITACPHCEKVWADPSVTSWGEGDIQRAEKIIEELSQNP